nr:hypothetical protein [Xanthomonas citri]
MSMKGKPNTAQFKPPKDPTAFLEGGEADKAEKPLVAPAAVTTTPAATPPAAEETQRYGRARVQKNLQLPPRNWLITCGAKRSSARKRRAAGSRRRTS